MVIERIGTGDMNKVTTFSGAEFIWRGKEGKMFLGDINSPSGYFLLFKKSRCKVQLADISCMIGDAIFIRSHKTGICKLFECFDEGLDHGLAFKKYRSDDLLYVTIFDDSLYYESYF